MDSAKKKHISKVQELEENLEEVWQSRMTSFKANIPNVKSSYSS
jgi:hypothetical protein